MQARMSSYESPHGGEEEVMTDEATIVTTSCSADDECMLDFGADEVSKIVYPQTTEKMTEKEFVRKSVKGSYAWVFWLLIAALAFGVFVASTVAIVDMAFAGIEGQVAAGK